MAKNDRFSDVFFVEKITKASQMAARVTKAYDPNQPRDEQGRWGSGGASSIGSFEQFQEAYAKDEAVQEWRKSWSESEKSSINGYIDSPQINNEMRDGRPDNRSYQTQRDDLDKAIDRAPKFDEEAIVHRTMNKGVLSVGDEYTDPAYLSVSQAEFSQNIWRRRRDPDDIEKLRIIVPKGTPRALIERFPNEPDLNMTELLLPRGGKYRVESQDDDGTFNVRLL